MVCRGIKYITVGVAHHKHILKQQGWAAAPHCANSSLSSFNVLLIVAGLHSTTSFSWCQPRLFLLQLMSLEVPPSRYLIHASCAIPNSDRAVCTGSQLDALVNLVVCIAQCIKAFTDLLRQINLAKLMQKGSGCHSHHPLLLGRLEPPAWQCFMPSL